MKRDEHVCFLVMKAVVILANSVIHWGGKP